jgi:hypothetical protein
MTERHRSISQGPPVFDTYVDTSDILLDYISAAVMMSLAFRFATLSLLFSRHLVVLSDAL